MEIESIKWGQITVNGVNYKDIIISPNGCKEWDWRINDTHHFPGIKRKDISY